jgi:tetratricopeptide (TPR) repeat protein
VELIILAVLIGISYEQKFRIIRRWCDRLRDWCYLKWQQWQNQRYNLRAKSIRRNPSISSDVSPQLQNQLIQLFDGDRKRAEELVANVRFGLRGKSEAYYWSLALQRKRQALERSHALTSDNAVQTHPLATSNSQQQRNSKATLGLEALSLRTRVRPTKAHPNLTFPEYPSSPEISNGSHDRQQVIKLHLNAALDLTKQHKFELALPILNRLINEYSDCFQARLMRGRAFRDLGKYDAALSDFDHVIQQHPHHIAAHRDKGLIEYEQRNYQEAIASLSIVIGHLPSAHLFKVRGNAYKGLGQNEAAIVDYLSAKKIYARQGVKHQVRQIEKQIHILYGITAKMSSYVGSQSHTSQRVKTFPFEKGRKQDQQHLLTLLHDDRAKACRLLESTRSRYPSRSINWYFEKTIHDLERDRH